LRHKDEIEDVLIKKYKPNIIGFTETHITQQIEDHELQISGYVCVRGDSESSRTGGVLLYIDRRIKFDIIAIETCEKNWWTTTVKIKDKNYTGIIMVVYHSPNGKDASLIDFLEETCISNMQNDNVIIMGDFNIDMKVNNYIQNKLTRVMNSVGLKQLITEATRIAKILRQ
jgi:exonuclease III